MIKINLLPVRAVKKRELGKQQVFLLAIVLFAVVGGDVFWYMRVRDFSNQLQFRIDKTRADITLLDKTIGEVKNITKEKLALEEKLKVLDTLRKGRTGPVQMMDELAGVIPTRVWIGRFEEKGGAVSMSGSAVSHDDVAQFMKKLKTSKHFKNVILKGATQKRENQVDFTINCNADYGAS